MARAAPTRAESRLPAYALYGEADSSWGVDRLHCESIAARSRLHDWEIRPHRHDALFQILYMRRGRARIRIEGRDFALRGPCVVTVPALTAHGFAFSSDVDGLVFTVVEQHLRRLLAQEPQMADKLLQLRCEALPAAVARPVRDAVAALRDEHAGTAAWRALAIDSALLRLALVLVRGLPDREEARGSAGGRALEHVRRFRALVEQRYREQPTLAAMAGGLGITPTQLNRVCRAILGQSPLQVLHARTVLEAQRELAYTTLSIKQIAWNLGFEDAAYFTRFFQRETGQAPSAWRAAARQA